MNDVESVSTIAQATVQVCLSPIATLHSLRVLHGILCPGARQPDKGGLFRRWMFLVHTRNFSADAGRQFSHFRLYEQRGNGPDYV